MHVSSNHPRVIVFPPVVPIATIVAAALLGSLWPLDWLNRLPRLGTALVGGAMIAVGAGLLISGAVALRRAGTNIRPSQPTLHLVEHGIYRWTRNPFYFGGSLAMLGCAFLFGLDWLLPLLPVDVAILHLGIVLPEEAYLSDRFGDAYRRYAARVPRYFSPF